MNRGSERPNFERPNFESSIEVARALKVRREVIVQRTDELLRWARASSPPPTPWRRLFSWAIPALVVASALILIIALRSSATTLLAPATTETRVVELGQRVAIVASLDAEWVVHRTDERTTEVEVIDGSVTARLYAGDARHRLRLFAGELSVLARGTIYALSVSNGNAVTTVHEGQVEVREGTDVRRLVAGESWPASPLQSLAKESAAAAMALSHHRRTPPSSAPASAADAAPADASPDAASRDSAKSSVERNDASRSLADRWRLARLLRSQAKYGEALDELRALSRTNDAVWAPISAAEIVRIYARNLSKPTATIRAAESFLRRFPRHQLASDVATLLCRAHQQEGTAGPPRCAR